jgi:hypothetical protein
MYERARLLSGGTVFCLAIIAASASCDGLGGTGGSGGSGGDAGQGGNGTPSTYCTNTPPGYDPILEKDIPADHPDAIPTYYSDVTLPGGCIHRFANAFQVRGGAKVTIEAGAVIEIGGGGSSNEIFASEGALIAKGTAAAPVEFRPAKGSTFGGIYVNDTGTVSLQHTYIHEVTHSLQTGGPDGACLTIYGNADTVPQGIVIEDSKFERCAYSGIRFGTELEDEGTLSALAGMYSSFARNEIVDSEYGFVVFNESLIAGIKEMPKTTGVKAHVTDVLANKNLDLTLLDGGIPWWGTAIDLDPGGKLRFEPGVVFEVHDIFGSKTYFDIQGEGELFLEGTADKPITISVDNGLSGGLTSFVKATMRHVHFKRVGLLEIGSNTIAENVIHEDCSGNEQTAFRVFGDGPVFASNTIRNCPIGIRVYQQTVSRVGAGNVYENVDHNQLEVSSTKVGTATWAGQSVPWVFGDIDVAGTLTLGPGVHLRGRDAFSGSTIIAISGAKIIAQGTAEQPVRFDGQEAGVNSWDGIELLGTATVDFTHVDLSEAWTGVYTDNGPITITNSTFHDNGRDIYTSCAPATVTNSTVKVMKDANCP